jgi:asparagine synthase (glutamine-hydrolysing)
MIFEVNIKESGGWNIYTQNEVRLYVKGYVCNKSFNELFHDLMYIKKNELRDYLNLLDGCFALVVERADLVIAIVDPVCSIPLFYVSYGNRWIIDSHAPSLIKSTRITQLNYDAVLALKMSGYTINKDTIYNELKTLTSGECIVFEGNKTPKILQYFQYQPWNIINNTKDFYRKELAIVTLNILRKVIKSLNNRQVVIPLSAGNDSRLIASGLKHLGYENVKCYSYGIKGHFESKIAEKIACELGYDYKFIPFTMNMEKRFYKSKEFQEFLEFSDNCMAVPAIQSLSTIKYLKKSGWINNDAIFINGNSGDFISGAHVSVFINTNYEDKSKKEREESIYEEIIRKHYSLWGDLKTELNLNNIKQQLINETPIKVTTSDKDHGIYEYSELINRQSKHVINNQRVYEFYGYEWRLPLWDIEYLRFWEKIPAQFKKNQTLYEEMLVNENWGGVWVDNMPINKKNLRPLWVIPIRFIFKLFFSLFGKKGKTLWHQFDTNIFYYWTDVTFKMKSIPYIEVVLSFNKRPRKVETPWLSQKYLSKHFSR